MANPTRFANGVSTRGRNHPLSPMGKPDPTQWITYFEDFFKWTAADWVIFDTVSSTKVVSTANGGVVAITLPATDNDAMHLQLSKDGGTTASAFITPAIGKKLFYKTRFSLTDGAASTAEVDFQCGFHEADASPIASASAGLIFRSAEGAATINGQVAGGTASKVGNSVAFTTGMHTATIVYNGRTSRNANDPAIFWYLDDVLILSTVSQNLNLNPHTIGFAVQNGATSASVLSIDYVLVTQER